MDIFEREAVAERERDDSSALTERYTSFRWSRHSGGQGSRVMRLSMWLSDFLAVIFSSFLVEANSSEAQGYRN